MNIIANNVASKLFVAFVAAAMVFTLATPAKAMTTEELQKQIAELTAQLAAMKGGSSTSHSSAACTFTRALTVGSQGEDVKCLQDYLTPTYFKNAGGSTGYFGPVTASAVAAWQSANGVSPAVGYFGPVSQAKYSAMAAMHDDEDEDMDDEDATDEDDEDSTDDEDDSSNDGPLSGEASLDTLEVSDGDENDEVEEDTVDAQVAEIDVEFADGDALINRLDIALDATTDGNDDVDPWDTFDEVSLWVDGEEVAREDASDEDKYLDEDFGTLRFSNLDITAREDEEVTIVVAVSIQGSITGVSDGADWDIAATGLRFTDADDVTSTETTTDGLQAPASSYSSDNAEFTIEQAGEGDDLDVESSDEDPDEKTIAAEEDSNVEDDIFAFDLSAEDSDGDIEINEVTIVATATVASNMDDLINDFRLEIDGESYEAESYTGTGLVATVTFDIDGDVVIAENEVALAVLYADFEDMESGDEGSTITARVTDVDAEGVESGEDVTEDGTPVSGNTHTVRTEGIDVAAGDDSAEAQTIDGSDNDYGEYELEVEVTAFGEDLYIANTSSAFTFQVELSNGNATSTQIATSSTISSDADIESGYYRIDKDETETFTLRVTVDPAASGEGQDYRVQFLTMIYNDDPDTSTPGTETLTPASEFETDFARITD